MRVSPMAKRDSSWRELLDRWRLIQEEQEDDDDSFPSKHREIVRAKEQWFSDSFDYLHDLPKESHIWCDCSDIMGPLLETFHSYFDDKHDNSRLKLIWKRISRELGQCTQCICQHHQAQETYSLEYEPATVDPLLKVLHCLDEERVTGCLKEINAKIRQGKYDPDRHSVEVVSLMFEVLMFPTLLDDQSLVNEFQIFIEAIDNSHELTLAGNQQYPGIYALLFCKSGKARAIGFRLAGNMGKLRRATDLEPLQPLLRKFIGILETEVLPSTSDASRPRVQVERLTVWLGIKTLLGFLESPAFEEGILEKYPIFLSIVLNHVSDDTPEFSFAVTCLKASFEMLGCNLWLRTTLSPSMMRNTLLGQSFHTRNEKSHKEIFDLFLPFLQSLEALQDGEHEKQRRHFLYFLLHQVPCSCNFSLLMNKNARKIAFLIIQRGYTMSPPSPPFECAHMWGPSLVCSLKDTSLHNSLRQPAFDLIQTIVVSDASALIYLWLKYKASSNKDTRASYNLMGDDDEHPFFHDVKEDTSCWIDFGVQNKLTSSECNKWICIPMLWFDALIEVGPSIFPVSFSKAVFWALSHISMMEPHSRLDMSASVRDWLSSSAGEISSSFGWEVPNGSDDGGDGIESRNSVNASFLCVPLIKTLKRFSAHFILQMKFHGLQKQWTWEPGMAESLILLLIDPNDSIRQAGRGILEHVSKTKGLTTGLQFLCSSACSMSSIFLGLRCASKQVQVDLLLDNFHNLHHFFFIVNKLLKDVTSPNKPFSNTIEDPKCAKFLSEGGFLRQPSIDPLAIESSGFSPIVVDMKAWEEFSYLLSEIMWPSLLKCIEEGKRLIDNKTCQMACIRLLETLAIIFERLSTHSSKSSGSSISLVPVIFDFRWFSDLVDWGKSSFDVIIRYWKQSLLSLLNFLKGSQSGIGSSVYSDIEAIVSIEKAEVEKLKEKVLHLKISLSSEASCTEGSISNSKPLLFGYFGKKNSWPQSCSYEDKVRHTRGTKTVQKTRVEEVIVLSDDERESMDPKRSSLSLDKSKLTQDISNSTGLSQAANKRSVSDGHMESASISESRSNLKPFPSRLFEEDHRISSQKQDGDALRHDTVSSEVGSTVSGVTSSLNILKYTTAGNKLGNSIKSSGKTNTIKEADTGKSVYCRPSSPTLLSKTSRTDLEVKKDEAVIKELIHDEIEDPLEHALDLARRSHSLLAKPSVSVPKRKVIQLQMPTNSKSGSLDRTISGRRRFKPPRLDDWYRFILQMDYFVILGLSSANEDEKTASNSLKEVPLCFQSLDHYVQIFRPLVLEEFKAQLNNSHLETSLDDVFRCSLSIISVEKVDDFYIVQGRPDEVEPAASRGCVENDLVLLTKEPLQNSVQQVHVVGKVERREKNTKSRSTIVVIRFYLPTGSSRLNTTKRLLTERSKWFLSHIMNITAQLREFQALSSLHDIPMLPIILNPVDSSTKYTEVKKVELGKLSHAMQKMLKSSFNNSQLEAISIAIGKKAWRNHFELSLIQGPPGTGKTRTIVAILSVLLACVTEHKNSSNIHRSSSGPISVKCTDSRTDITQSVQIARAWKDADFVKKMLKNAEKRSSEPTDRPSKGRVLVCAQSNAAVDELVSRISAGLYGNDGEVFKPYIVRVGNAKTIHPNSIPFFIDTLVEQRMADDMVNPHEVKNDTIESSSSLRARLEKIVDTIRCYESRRAKMQDGDTKTKASADDGTSKENNVHNLSDTAMGAKLNILYGQKKDICRDLAAAQARERKSSDESWYLKHKIRKTILKEAEIVVTTLSGCGGDLYGVCSESASSNKFGIFSEQNLFDVVVIDEAAQALEPATLIPLQLLKSNGSKCIMVGDPKQLPATVLSNVASKFLYECSMFERLQRAGHPVKMLTDQYRMHPEICSFPSLHFYENKLLNGEGMDSRLAPFHENAYLGPYVFYDIVDGREHHGKHSGSLSLCNVSEVEAAVGILKFFKKRYPSEFASKRVGIITPYRSQILLMRKHFYNAFGPNIVSDMEFNTVDGFQGREVDILVVSTVRSADSSAKTPTNKSSGIGFVADVRRMNVSLTRAKFSMWIFGNARTLQRNQHWSALIHNAKERRLFTPLTKPYNSIFEKDLPSSRDNVSSPTLGSSLSSSKRGARVKHKVQQVGETKNTGRREAQTSKEKQNTVNDEPQIGLAQTSRASNNVETIIKKPTNREEKSNKSQKQKEKLASTNALLNDSSTEALINKERGRKLSEQAKSSNSSQRNSSILSSSDGRENASKSDGSKSSSRGTSPGAGDLLLSRKRQREAVDALLSTALIPSKKPEASSRPAPVKRTSPTSQAIGGKKRPR